MWKPSKESIQNSQMSTFIKYVNHNFMIQIENYSQLYKWSLEHAEDFWESFWKFSGIIHHSKYNIVVDDITKMPGAKWFEGSTLNFAENLLRYKDNQIAIRFCGEDGVKSFLTYNSLYDQVAGLASAMKKQGIKKGDRVCGLLPNIPEAIIAMLASASIGAIWSSCSPDFGIQGVLDRFKQIMPKIIFTTDSYKYNGQVNNSSAKLKEILSKLPSIQINVIIPFIQDVKPIRISKSILWDDFVDPFSTEISFEQLPFDHPLYIMYSSGTTGLPKSIVHSAGGTLIQHLKELQLHTDLKRNDTIFYFTTCGWMMWNWLISSLSIGATVVLYDGSPFYPDGYVLHKLANEWGITVFGTSAKYITSLEAANIKPIDIYSFPQLRTILSTGSPLVEENYDYVYNYWKKDVQLASISGGTDIISCFALGNPLLPVYRGEIQCRGLGMKVEALDEAGKSIISKKGELVCKQAFPSMPVYFWNDPNGEKYYSAYFDTFLGYWHHGDYLQINDHGGVKIFGRSDTTLNPGGVRIGTSEIYQAVNRIKEIEDSLVIGQAWGNDERIILFIKMRDSNCLTEELKIQIQQTIRATCTPRHVPAKVIQVEEVPYTINGKKVELAVKQIIQNEEVKNKDSLANPEVLDYYQNLTEVLN
jgi:acetoacetyl-CoA synthetase